MVKLFDSICKISVKSVLRHRENISIKIVADINPIVSSCLTPPIVLAAQNTGAKKRVSYISDIHLHALHTGVHDTKLDTLLYKDDYVPTAFFNNLVEKLHNQIPVLWDYFRWDDSFWNLPEDSLAYMPRHWDGDINKWRLYDIDTPPRVMQQQNRIGEIPDKTLEDYSLISIYTLAFSLLEELEL